MNDTRTVHDPFLGKDVEVSNKLVDRLRGKYANGPTMPNGDPEFGWRQFQTPPIQHEAAREIEQLKAERDAAQEVSRTAERYVEAMKLRLEITLDMLRPFTKRDLSDPDCRAAHDWLSSVEAVKS